MEDKIKSISDAGALKQLGNTAFAKKEYDDAILAYTKAIECQRDPVERGTYHSNRALCYKNIGALEKALEDGDAAVAARPDWVKGYIRRGQALLALARYDEADSALAKAANFDAGNAEIAELRKTLKSKLSVFQDISPSKDGSAMLKVVAAGMSKNPYELCTCWAHYRISELSGEKKVLASSRAQMVMKGFQMVMAENQNAPPKRFIVDEAEVPEAVEIAVQRIGNGGEVVLQLKGDAMLDGRPEGDVEVLVELIRFDPPCGGPGKEKWQGLQSILSERIKGDEFLEGADSARGKLEAFDKLKAAADQSQEAALDVAKAVKKGSVLAERRYLRAKSWLESSDIPDKKNADVEKEKILQGLAKAIILHHQLFAVEQENQRDFGKDLVKFLKRYDKEPVTDDEAAVRRKEELSRARDLAVQAVETNPTSSSALTVLGLAWSALGDSAKAREYIQKALDIDPHNESIRSELARVNVKEKEGSLKDAETKVIRIKEDLDAAMAAADAKKIGELLAELGEMVDGDQVSWDCLMRSKVGKPVGQVQKDPPGGDKELRDLATKLIKKFRDMAERSRPLWS